MNRYDAIVLGGGPAGTSTAFFLSQAGWKVALVEKKTFPRRKVCGEFLSATSRPLLQSMGLGDTWATAAGPPVKRVGLFAKDSSVFSPMPVVPGPVAWGRALSRASLDMLLMEAAQEVGVHVLQPCRASSLMQEGDLYRCVVESDGVARQLSAPVIIAAHGSWEPGRLPTQPSYAKSSSDLMGFKLLFRGFKLDDDLMPLVVFPGGYGGMVHTECGLVGLSCCIRRDVLGDRRRFYGSASAAEAVLSHIRATTTAVADTLRGALEADVSLAAGPIHPGIRPRYLNGIFRVGNAAGEAHPVIAEGISMALQAGGLLAQTLIAKGSLNSRSLEESGSQYSRLWISQFGLRIEMAELLARLALSKHGPGLMARAVELFPSLLTVGANLSGKAKLAYGGRLEKVGT